jgi:hypothetical protein
MVWKLTSFQIVLKISCVICKEYQKDFDNRARQINRSVNLDTLLLPNSPFDNAFAASGTWWVTGRQQTMIQFCISRLSFHVSRFVVEQCLSRRTNASYVCEADRAMGLHTSVINTIGQPYIQSRKLFRYPAKTSTMPKIVIRPSSSLRPEHYPLLLAPLIPPIHPHQCL